MAILRLPLSRVAATGQDPGGEAPWPVPVAADVVVVDLDAWAEPGAAPTIDPFLPVVIVGTTSTGLGPAHPAAPGCDLVLGAGDAPALEVVASTVASAPIAAAALAGLLRGSAARSLEEGLLAESAVYSALQAGPEFAAWRAACPRRAPHPDAEPVRVQRTGDALHITLERPAVRNAFDARMRDALVEALTLAWLDPTIAEVHLRGSGPAFCSGGDLDEFGTTPDPATAHLVRLQRSGARAVARVAERVTAHVHGACVGSGIELPAFAGRVIAAPDATFALPEVAMGLIPGAGGTVSLPARIGRHRTAELAFAGAAIDAATALAWGLVDQVGD